MTPFWVTAYLDLAPAEHREGLHLWQRLTGYEVSAARGDQGEYASLLPPDGDDYLDVQRLGSGPSRIHLDLHVDDPFTASEAAVRAGALVVSDHDDYLTLTDGDVVRRVRSRGAAPRGCRGTVPPHRAG